MLRNRDPTLSLFVRGLSLRLVFVPQSLNYRYTPEKATVEGRAPRNSGSVTPGGNAGLTSQPSVNWKPSRQGRFPKKGHQPISEQLSSQLIKCAYG